MQLPWLNVPSNASYRAQKMVTWGNPLTKSYPQAIFAVTAQNGAPLAPGEQPWPRIQNTGLQTSGDPRATGSFFDITSDTSLQQLIAGLPPTSVNVGGSSIFSPTSNNVDNWFLWIAVAGMVAAFFLWND